MCGIAGVVALTEDRRPVDPKAVTRMSERLSHRGPDGVRGFVSRSGACALGHARLAVIDLHTGDQPMTVADESVHVVCNGEIYNFRALRRELEEKGHRIARLGDWSPGVGGGQGIMVDPDSGSFMGGADPRRDGYALGW